MAVALAVTAAAAGCGFGEGEESEGEATLTVTREYGSEPVLEASVSDPPESETVIRLLDREAEITTRFGGGFVHSIEGVSGEIDDGRTRDWFFFVNGIESSLGAAEVTVRGGDRIWWDHRDWTNALRTPAVVGSWPEPFAQTSARDEALPVRVECAGSRAPCERAAERLAEAGVDASVTEPSADPDAVRVLVGTWMELHEIPIARGLRAGPGTSGVFVWFDHDRSGADLVAYDERAFEAGRFRRRAGLVAAVRNADDPPTWIVTGTDPAGLDDAVELLDEDSLDDRYAVAVADGAELPLPVPSEE